MIIIIDYDAGNLRSVKRALDFLKIENKISSNKQDILNAEKLIIPGVGASRHAMENLRKNDLIYHIKDTIKNGVPCLGICLGIQLFLEYSFEDGGTDLLSMVKGKVHKFNFDDKRYTIPHMGWNQVSFKKNNFMFKGIKENSNFYFVHSYYPVLDDESLSIATTQHGSCSFTSVLNYKNIVASQFHPEKSGKNGLLFLKNFAEWNI